MKKLLLLFAAFVASYAVQAESDKPYYYQIPEAPDSYSGPNVAARLVDGLGFRFFWATEGLRAEDLAYSPGEERRSIENTIDHIFTLTLIAANATRGETTVFPVDLKGMSFAEKRAGALANIKTASVNLKGATEQDMESFKMAFQYPDGGTGEYPFWNEVNGPIADALWHCGQIVSFRRSSGNPLQSNLSLLEGRLRE